MDANTTAQEKLRRQQLLFVAQIQGGPACAEYDDEPWEETQARYNQACGAYMDSKRHGGTSPEEEAIFSQMQAQYDEKKAKHDEDLKTKSKTTMDSSKRRKASPSPLFVQQDQLDFDEEINATKTKSGSKRKRTNASKSSSESSKLLQVDEGIMYAVNRLIENAPTNMKHAAIRDGARIVHAVRQFPSGTIEYDGGDTWSMNGMQVSLKHHQLINAGWMKEQETRGKGPKGGILADDMGLGKTISALANMVHGKRTPDSQDSMTDLVVVPKSLKDQWYNEASDHTVRSSAKEIPGLGHVHEYSTDTSVKSQLRKFKEAGLVVATYSELYSGFKNFAYPNNMSEAEKEKYFDRKYRPSLSALFRFKFRSIYLDEGHDIRNPKALRTMACLKLQSEQRWVLTGTPMTNRPTDLYSVLVFIRDPTVSKLTLKEFNDKYKGPSKRDINVDWVADILQRCMGRWTHRDMLFGRRLVDIPEPIFLDICKRLSVPERIIYATVRNRLKALAIEKMTDPDSTKTYKFVSGLLMVLRQMTGHVLLIRPAIFRYLTDEDMSTIYDAIYDQKLTKWPTPSQTDEQGIKEESAEPVTPDLDPHAEDYIKALRKLQKSTTCVECEQRTQDVLWAECYHAYCEECLAKIMHDDAEHGFDKPRCRPCGLPMGRLTDQAEDEQDETPRWLNEDGKVIPSTKSSEVVKLLKSWKDPHTGDPQAKAVVFTSFKDPQKFLAATFEEEGWNFSVLTASMSSAEREKSVDEFMDDPDKFIMLATHGVGGLGLNLTAAKYVFHTRCPVAQLTRLQISHQL